MAQPRNDKSSTISPYKHPSRLGWAILWVGSLLVGPLTGFAQCPTLSGDTLISAQFERTINSDWRTSAPSDGGSWTQNDGAIGVFENPGSGKWLYLNDEANNDIGKAHLDLPTIDLAAYRGRILLQMDLLFQSFADSGSCQIMVWDDMNWKPAWTSREDFNGTLTLDLSEWRGKALSVRIIYDDEGAWGWGMGIDNVYLVASGGYCGDGFCAAGESSETCPDDCESLTDPAPAWVPIGQDLEGHTVSYKYFQGNTRCDDCTQKIDLGFDFRFFGQTYQSVWMNSNGNLTLDDQFLAFTPAPFCLNGPNMIAPFFADVDLLSGGEIRYHLDPAHRYLIVTWSETGYYGCIQDCPRRNTFQVVITNGSVDQIGDTPLPPNTNMVFSYGDMQWTTGTSSGGKNGFGGHAATVGANAGDGFTCQDYGTFDHEGPTYLGNYQDRMCPPNGVDHLDFRSIFLNEMGQSLSTDTLPDLTTDSLRQDHMIQIQAATQSQGVLISWQIRPPSQQPIQIIRGSSRDSLRYLEELSFSDTTPSGGFEYFDAGPIEGSSFYQIRFEDQSGNTFESEVIEVTFNRGRQATPGFLLEAIGPNPFEDRLNIQTRNDAEGLVAFQLSNINGQIMVQGTWSANQGHNEFSLKLPPLPPGSYVISLSYHGKRITRKLIRQPDGD
ncbi:nidogen-like domain-containing protein [Pontibacter sp. G13]|uniref:nidogen-like domain-containing protein n=1 Tax=Pontibacter sp. G13 TaxID=3074898 RepID=UPI00288A8BB6|nr:nidogen-like domain-containing protein [Pontibacter sp. G13]WNJ17377.1 T9SS type A sorting domain-containing protein [Pontibacter sp. G13]